METLVEAVLSGDLQVLQELLMPHSSSISISTPIDEADTTLLHLAASKLVPPAVVRKLLNHGALVNCQNDDGMSALHVAAMWGNVAAAKLLLCNGGNPFLKDSNDMTPLDHATSQGHTSCAVLFSGEGTDALGEGEEEEIANSEEESTLGDGVNADISMAEAFVSMLANDFTLTPPTNSTTPTPVNSPTPADNHEISPSSPSILPASLVTPHSLPELDTSTRRELFPDDDKAYFEETILLDVPTSNSALDDQATVTLDSPASPKPEYSIPGWIMQLSNVELRQRLESLGEHPGPINSSTRSAYQLYLTKIEAGVQPKGNKGFKGFKYELALALNGTVDIPDLTSVENQVFQSFRKPAMPFTTSPTPASLWTSPRPRAFPKKNTKDHFNYFLLDPMILDKIKVASTDLKRFQIFIESVFYIGKGKNSRPFQHLKDAASSTKVSSKLAKILSIWSQGRGVVSLHLFQNTTAEEAFTREACLIDAIGLDMLTNVQRGHVYGEVCGWRMGKRRSLGVHLLHKALKTFILDSPQEIFEDDL